MSPYRCSAPPNAPVTDPPDRETTGTSLRFSLAIGALGLLGWVPSLLLGRPFGTQEAISALCTLFALFAR